MSVILFAKRRRGLFATILLAVVGLFVLQSQQVHAQPANITLNSDQSIIRIDWDETSASPVDDYLIEASTDGVSWETFLHPPTNDTFLEIPRNLITNLYDVNFYIRITTLFSDSSTSPTVTANLTMPAYYSYGVSNDFVAGTPTTVITDAQRKTLGLDYWVDGNIGFFERNGSIVSLSANGPYTARTVKSPSDTSLLGSLTSSNISIQNQTIASDYASGGPVYYDNASDRLLMFYHGEIHQPNDATFYGYIGMAVSYDGGQTFDDLGQIIRPNIDINDPDRVAPTEVGGAPYIIKDGFFYVYFKDMAPDGSVVNLAVARAPIEDVLAAAALGNTVAWSKYSSGGFTTPGIGGQADDILANHPTAVWFDTAYIQSLKKYVMVYSNGYSAPSSHLITTSEDGIVWSDPELLYDSPSQNEMSFLTISSPDFSNQRVITGDHFYLYRTVSSTAYSGFRWDDAWVEVLNVSFNVPDDGIESSIDDSDGQSRGDTTGDALAKTGISQMGIFVVSSIMTIGTALYLMHRSNNKTW